MVQGWEVGARSRELLQRRGGELLRLAVLLAGKRHDADPIAVPLSTGPERANCRNPGSP